MPNWVRNILTVTGEQRDLQQFMIHARGPQADLDCEGTVLTFQAFIPMPEEVANVTSLCEERRVDIIFGEPSTREDWARKNWGTKWDAVRASVTDPMPSPHGGQEIQYWFETPWSPPTRLIEEVQHQFPRLRFSLNAREEYGARFGFVPAPPREYEKDAVT